MAAVILGAVCGCGAPVDVDLTTPSEAEAEQCRDLVSDLPDEVDGLEQRDTDPDSDLVAAWGDPAVVLRCGVAKPPELVASSLCYEVNGVGWFATENGEPLDGSGPTTGTVVFTTIGRSPYVEVTVPDDPDRSAGDPLADLAGPVDAYTSVQMPCQ